MPTVYVLQSLKDGKTYVGSTDNFERRLLEHQKGKVISTKCRIPFKVLLLKILIQLKLLEKEKIGTKAVLEEED